MKGKLRRLRLVSLMLTGLMLVAACDSSPQAPATATTGPSATSTGVGNTPVANDATSTVNPTSGEMVTVRLGYVPVMIFAPIFVAQERGYFTNENLKVELSPVQGGSDSVVQLAAGNFDAAMGGAGAGLFNAAQRGIKFTIVAPMHSERPPLTSPLVISAKRAGEFKSVADLKGKKVSINATGAATEYWLAQALEKNGLTINDVQVQTVPFGQVPAALESGSLDAAILGEPLATINKDKGLVTVLADDFINDFHSTFLYMGEPLLKGKPDAAKRFMRAYLRACRDLQGSYMNQEIADIIAKYTPPVPASVILRASPAQYDPNGTVPIQDLNTLQEYFIKRGVLEYKEPLDLTPFVNTELAKEVAAELDKK